MYRTRRYATLRRSVRLLRSFVYEQFRPRIFYESLARDTFLLIDALLLDLTASPLKGKTVLDVGGGPGYFAPAFKGNAYVSVDLEDGTVRGDGRHLPFADNSFDVVYSSNVAEHVPDWREMAAEMVRVTKPGGLTIISYTVWLGPFGGHETGLIPHYVGGGYARRRYVTRHGHEPKNKWGESLFAVSAKEGLAWEHDVAFPRYHPSWAWWLTRVPLVREFLVSNLVLVRVIPPPSPPRRALP